MGFSICLLVKNSNSKESETSPVRKETMLIVRIAYTANNWCVTNLNLVTTFTDIPWLAQ